ncbi:MAG: glycosyltransferase family 4 protein [bacterium]
MKKINVLYYEVTSGYGGSSRCLLSWLKRLDKERYYPIVVVHFNGPAIKEIRELGVKTITIPFKPFVASEVTLLFSYIFLFFEALVHYIPTIIYIYIIIKKYQINLIHLNTKVNGVVSGIIAAKLSGTPCICHLHDIKAPIKRERILAKWIDCFIVLTDKALKLYEKEYPNKRLELIYNGINVDEYSRILNNNAGGLKEELDIKNKEKVIGIAGRLVKGKGFSDFIKAAKIVLRDISNVKFLVVGSAPKEGKAFEEYLKKMTRELGLEQEVLFTGWRQDIKETMLVFDVLVQASSTFPEGFGLTCVEAMALKKPVVVTNIPGPSEIVLDGITGFVVPPGKPEALAVAIKRLILDNNLAKKMGESGRKRVEEFFNLDLTIKKIEELYSIFNN